VGCVGGLCVYVVDGDGVGGGGVVSVSVCEEGFVGGWVCQCVGGCGWEGVSVCSVGGCGWVCQCVVDVGGRVVSV